MPGVATQWHHTQNRLLLGALAVLVFLFFFPSPWIGILFLLLLIMGVASKSSTVALFGTHTAERCLIGSMLFWSVTSLLCTGSYFALPTLDLWWIAIILIGLSCAWILIPGERWQPPNGSHSQWPLLLPIVIGDALLITMFAAARTNDPLISVWNMLGPEVFVIFGLTTLLLFHASRSAHATWHILGLQSLHVFTMVSVAALMHGIGFGFDPFVHRAAETALAQTGAIEPKQILYAGQYVLVSGLHLLTAIPLKLLDIWLVPLFASLFLPLATFVGLSRGWNLSAPEARTWSMTLFILPFMLSVFTVPFTVTYTFFLGLVFLLPISQRSRAHWIILLLASLAATLFHPLLMGPLLPLIFFFPARTRFPRLAPLLILIFSAISVPVMFFVHQGGTLDSLVVLNPLHRIDLFTSLFRNIFTVDHYPFVPWSLDLIYQLRHYLPYAFSLAGLGSLFLLTKQQRRIALPYLAFALGLLLSIFGARTLFWFDGIIAHEQGEFSLRLVQALFVISLPLIAVGLANLTKTYRRWISYSLFTLLTLLILHAWFFSYPQFNLKYPFFSPSVGQEDIEAVRLIDMEANGADYIVLSNQMTSAAALQEFGFAQYHLLGEEEILWYAIPTGGKLYEYYIRQLQADVARAPFDELHERTGVDHIYFVTHSYWPWTESFIHEMTRISNQQFFIEEKVTIYQFRYDYGHKDED